MLGRQAFGRANLDVRMVVAVVLDQHLLAHSLHYGGDLDDEATASTPG
jgi:hypothetical protein